MEYCMPIDEFFEKSGLDKLINSLRCRLFLTTEKVDFSGMTFTWIDEEGNEKTYEV